MINQNEIEEAAKEFVRDSDVPIMDTYDSHQERFSQGANWVINLLKERSEGVESNRIAILESRIEKLREALEAIKRWGYPGKNSTSGRYKVEQCDESVSVSTEALALDDQLKEGK